MNVAAVVLDTVPLPWCGKTRNNAGGILMWYRGGWGTSLPGDKFDGDNFGRGKVPHLQDS